MRHVELGEVEVSHAHCGSWHTVVPPHKTSLPKGPTRSTSSLVTTKTAALRCSRSGG